MYLEYYAAMGTLAFGIAGGIYFIFDWFRHRMRAHFLIMWAVGFFLLFWFQVPLIKGDSGATIVTTDFNTFFAVVFPLAILALLLIWAGLQSALGVLSEKKKIVAIFYFLASVVAFEMDFIIHGGILQNYVFMFATLFLFHAPIEAMIAVSAWRMRRGTERTIVGAYLMAAGGLFGIAQDFLVASRAIAYPPRFWFIALMSFSALHAVQLASVILLLAGAILIHIRYVRTDIIAHLRGAAPQ